MEGLRSAISAGLTNTPSLRGNYLRDVMSSPAPDRQDSHVSDILVYRGSVSVLLVADRWCLGLRLNEVAAAVDLATPTGRFDMTPGS